MIVIHGEGVAQMAPGLATEIEVRERAFRYTLAECIACVRLVHG
jgi:hypothetical protein